MPDYRTLTPEKALIFRITHLDNIPWILDHGVHAASSETRDPNFIAIGKPDLIERRKRQEIPISPGGSLADYVPFYFAPRTPMLHNIVTGRGVTQHSRQDIVFLVSSVALLSEKGVTCIFTDRHPVLQAAEYFGDPAGLSRLPWDAFRRGDYTRNPDDPGRFDRYQAEALAYRHVPLDALLGLGCYADEVKAGLDTLVGERGSGLKCAVKQGWYP
jgi:hypothetical protein